MGDVSMEMWQSRWGVWRCRLILLLLLYVVVCCVLWVVFAGGTDFSVTVVQIRKPLTKKGRKYDPEYYLGMHNFPTNTPVWVEGYLNSSVLTYDFLCGNTTSVVFSN